MQMRVCWPSAATADTFSSSLGAACNFVLSSISGDVSRSRYMLFVNFDGVYILRFLNLISSPFPKTPTILKWTLKFLILDINLIKSDFDTIVESDFDTMGFLLSVFITQ